MIERVTPEDIAKDLLGSRRLVDRLARSTTTNAAIPPDDNAAVTVSTNSFVTAGSWWWPFTTVRRVHLYFEWEAPAGHYLTVKLVQEHPSGEVDLWETLLIGAQTTDGLEGEIVSEIIDIDELVTGTFPWRFRLDAHHGGGTAPYPVVYFRYPLNTHGV